MNVLLQPWQFLFVVFCGWVHQRQTEIIEFQNDELTALMQKLGKKRLLLTDDQRRLLAVPTENPIRGSWWLRRCISIAFVAWSALVVWLLDSLTTPKLPDSRNGIGGYAAASQTPTQICALKTQPDVRQ